MTLCGDCGGSCCSRALLNVTLRDIQPGEDVKRALHRDPPYDLLRPSGKLAPMRFFTGTIGDGEKAARAIVFKCDAFDMDTRRCGIYADRPMMCREFECPPMRGEVRLGDFLRKARPMPLRNPRDVTRMVLDAARLATLGPVRGRRDA